MRECGAALRALARPLLTSTSMRISSLSLARTGTLSVLGGALLFLSGCPATHTTVRSCGEAADAPDGTACEGFTSCEASTPRCTPIRYCDGGTLRTNFMPFVQCEDAGPSGDGGHLADAAPVDAGPCAPAPPPSGTPCHTSADCDPSRFEMCFAPGASLGCGPCVPPERVCTSDADCVLADGRVGICESYVNPCSHPFACGAGADVTSTRCIPRCTTDASCGAGMRCNPDGTCRALSCMEGYVCPMFTHCGDLPGGDAHGCVRQSCSVDGDCGCGGACLTGSCFDTLGACAAPAA